MLAIDQLFSGCIHFFLFVEQFVYCGKNDFVLINQ